ncbi:GRB2-associated-binding protein 1-like isoform X2 [Dunckerocampus dactyliophorus]|uniref:GRB2-associated-binding protein 1-like isoform X2 n=1 Tax=Dunckerocampus dactyliophorus TaxID=161453 RepID=UPI0024057B2B|nr:GRB2-associated-binding protein 1-like isoform X2 [Dunckerocampus dactyliophorus]
MSGAGEVVCAGWLRKSPPEKKLRRYAWKRRWFMLRSGRLSGEPDVLQYYKNPHSRRPIRTINLNLCEQVDAGLSFTKKELEKSFVFDVRTEERTWYLVAESEEDMNRWVASICLLCGFNPTDEVPDSPPVSSTSPSGTIATVTVSDAPYEPVRLRPLEADGGSMEEDYLWLVQCQTHFRPPDGSSTSLESDSGDQLFPPPSATSSSSSPTPSRLPTSLSTFSSSSQTAPWVVAAMTDTLSQSLDSSMAPYLQRGGGKPRCHPSPHPRKHSLDIHLRPVAIPHSSGYQIPRPASAPQPVPPLRPSSTPSVDSLTQAELRTSTPTPPPRPPKPIAMAAQGESSTNGPASESGPRSGSAEVGWGMARNNSATTPGSWKSLSLASSLSDRASMFEFSDRFNSYFLNKGMMPLGSVCSEDDDVDENYVPMNAATTEPPHAAKPSEVSHHHQEASYVPMTPLAPHLPAAADLASLGRQVPPPAHTGFRNSPLRPLAHPAPHLRTAEGDLEGVPPPVHRDLKPQRRVRPAPLNIPPVQQEWQEVAPPVRSPVTRTFTRHPSSCHSVRPTSAHSSSPSSDSDDPDDSYIAMTTSSLSFSAGEPSLRLMLHRASEGGVSSPIIRRAGGTKQVEYLDLDLHVGQVTPTRQTTVVTSWLEEVKSAPVVSAHVWTT